MLQVGWTTSTCPKAAFATLEPQWPAPRLYILQLKLKWHVESFSLKLEVTRLATLGISGHIFQVLHWGSTALLEIYVNTNRRGDLSTECPVYSVTNEAINVCMCV